MKPFREMNPVSIGAIGIAVILCLLLAAFNIESVPLVGGGRTFQAAFTEAGGLKVDDEVRVAGVRVGKVEKLGLEGKRVVVDFRVEEDDVWLGNRTGAAIKIKTALGEKYLALMPRGSEPLGEDTRIPSSRTLAPYDVVEAFSGLTETVQKIDSKRLALAFDTLSATFADSPAEVKASLRGLTRLSQTVSSRDAKLRGLLKSSRGVTKVLADRNEDLTKLMRDGSKLFRAVQKRRAVIHQLLVNSVALSTQLTGLVDENRKQLKSALKHLARVVALLQRNQNNLDKSIKSLATFVRLFGNVVGTGRWFDAYIQNLVPLPPSISLPKTAAGGKGGGS
ncbi:MAG: MCE family protein [Streptosporangiales bacterium]|nr:MCE family protein [Streptosporangiales bacterium]